MQLGLVLSVLSLALPAACGDVPASPPPTATAVASPTVAPTASPSPTVEPTSTPRPQTPTRVPTATPDPDATPTPAPVIIRSTRDDDEGPATEFEMTLLSGEGFVLSDLKRSVVVLNFWASWCVPCRQEMPAFELIYQEYKDRDVVFVGVAYADTEPEARAFAEQVGVSYPLGMDVTDEISESYGIQALPTTFFIDREGIITKKITGLATEGLLRIFLNSRVR